MLDGVGAWRDEVEVDLGPRRQRAVLAVLLLRQGRVVPTEDILAAVWGEELPANGPNVISKYVGRLRRLLDDDVLDRVDAGYAARVDEDAVDLSVLTRRLAAARALRRNGDTAGAAAELHSAHLLTRGTPLAGMAGAFFEVERDRLIELGLTVTEERIDADLALGRHGELVSELTGLVTAHPLRERLAGQLMLALYRTGRQADAFAVHRELRERLADELGVDPGPEVTSVYESILRAEPDQTPVTAPSPVPRQLPAGVGDFTGRSEELSWLTAELRIPQDATRVMAITGRGGVGKTSLAVQLSHQVRDAFPDGQLYVELTSTDAVADVYARLLRALGVGGGAIPAPAERAALYRTLTADKRLLLVLDNATAEDQVRPLVPASRSAAVVVTSRSRLTGLPAVRRLELDIMPADQATRLLDSMVGADRLAREPADAAELVRLCGRLPLALRIAGARLAANPHWTLRRFVGRLADERRRLDELRHNDLEVRASLNLSYQVLSPQARDLLMRISLLAVPAIAAWTAAVLLDCDLDGAEDVLDQLLAARMVEVDSGRYRCHDLVQLFSREEAERTLTADERDAVLDRALGAWLYLAEQADAMLPHGYFSRPRGTAPRHVLAPVRDPLAWFQNERTNLAALVRQAIAAGKAAAAWELAASALAFYEVRAHFADWSDTHTRALAAVREADDLLGTAVILRGLGELHTCQDRITDSLECFEAARAIFVRLGHRHGVAVCDNGLGHMHRVSGQYGQAAEAFRAAAASSAADGYSRTESYARHCLGVVLLERRDFEEAEREFRAALDLASASGFRRGEAQSERGLGLLHLATGDLATAELRLQRALATSTDLAEPSGEAGALQMLVELRIRQGELAGLHPMVARCMEIYTELGEPFGQALVLRTAGELLLAEGRPADALARLTESVRIWSGLELPLWHGRALTVLGRAHAELGHDGAAKACWQQAFSLFTAIGAPEATLVPQH
jgi:DNA-binding SARP family transcriptional activator/tetratricopeptide (TPR) repeat protein